MDIVSVHLHAAVTRSSHRDFDWSALSSPASLAGVTCVVEPEVDDLGARTGPGELLLDRALRDRLTVTGEDKITDVRDLRPPILSADLVEDLPHRLSQRTDLRH